MSLQYDFIAQSWAVPPDPPEVLEELPDSFFEGFDEEPDPAPYSDRDYARDVCQPLVNP